MIRTFWHQTYFNLLHGLLTAFTRLRGLIQLFHWVSCTHTTNDEDKETANMHYSITEMILCCNALYQYTMCLVPWSTCTLQVPLCTKCEFLKFENCIFTIKMWCDSRSHLGRWVLMTVKLASHQVKKEFVSLNCKLSSVSKLPSFPWFPMAVALYCNI